MQAAFEAAKGKRKRKQKGAVYYTFSDGKASVEVRTEIEEMWYNCDCGEKREYKKQRRKFAVEERKKSFLIVKRGEIPSIFLTVFCKCFGNGQGKVWILRTRTSAQGDAE